MKTEVRVGKQPYFSARRIAVIALLGAISVVLGSTPLGYIPLFGILQVTLMHIPVIIAAIVEGPIAGMIVGLIFGVSSIIVGLSSPLGPIFMNPMVSVFPRVMIGLVSAYVYKALYSAGKYQKNLEDGKKRSFRSLCGKYAVPITAAAGTATNTIGVMGMIYVFYVKTFMEIVAVKDFLVYLYSSVALNALAEIVIAVIVVTAVVKGISKIRK
jgi:uncharacterized membrane protein